MLGRKIKQMFSSPEFVSKFINNIAKDLDVQFSNSDEGNQEKYEILKLG